MREADPVISGVPLAQYAAVTAALGEAFPLKAVLAVEGLAPARWAEADRGWTARLAEDPALLARYEAEIGVAADRLARTVEPIDADLGAWVAFLAVLDRAPRPSELLEQHGIAPEDLARLQRRWDARMRDEPGLEKRAAELHKSAPDKLPPLRVVKGKLTRSGTGAGAPAAPAVTSAAVAAPAPVPMVEPPRPPAPPAPAPAPAPAPPERPSPRAIVERHATPQGSEEDGTLVAFELPKTSLPFQATPSRAFLQAMDRPVAAPGDGSDGETVALTGAAALRALTLHEEAPPAEADFSGTVIAMAPSFTSGPLPFTPATSEPASSDDEPPPSSVPMPGRTVVMRVPRRPAAPPPDEATRILQFPFSAEAPPRHDGGDPQTPGTTITGMHSPFARKALPFDAPDGDDPAARSLEIRPKRKAPRAPAPSPPPLPEPSLSLERHASICLELALDPTHAADVLSRYQVSADEKARADELYRARLAADPELRAQWNRAFEIYRAWFTSQPRP